MIIALFGTGDYDGVTIMRDDANGTNRIAILDAAAAVLDRAEKDDKSRHPITAVY
ncbi:MAG: hypothetical protein JSR65_08465 [Proteobacteria bacterium]|nr:hypothetical protein [Pseudomonadota bacterium]